MFQKTSFQFSVSIVSLVGLELDGAKTFIGKMVTLLWAFTQYIPRNMHTVYALLFLLWFGCSQ